MPTERTEQESFIFIEECGFALKELFNTLKPLLRASQEFEKQLADIESTKKVFLSKFIDQDQWSVNANYHYTHYLDRMQALNAQKQNIEAAKIRQVKDLLAKIGATQESMAILAGAILQIGKQVLSFRYGTKPSHLAGVRQVGSQSVVELIWEGRNHALHWEDQKSKQPVQDMLNKLHKEGKAKIETDKNNACIILDALEWSDADKVIADLKTLVRSTQ